MAYFLVPLGQDTVESQAFDSDEELQKLNFAPSPRFCALQHRPMCCAHGGDIDTAPPNTLAAFTAALDMGLTCVEVDVSMTRDGQLAALHDRDLASLLRLNGLLPTAQPHPRGRLPWSLFGAKTFTEPRVSDFMWEQISSLTWGDDHPGEKVVSLQTTLRTVLPHNATVIVDVKLREGVSEDVEAASMAQAVHDALNTAKCGDACLVWAKSDAVAVEMKALNTRRRVGIIVVNDTATAREKGMHNPMRLPQLKVEVAGVHWGLATPHLVSQLKVVAGYREVYVWTANTAAMMTAALESGADAVVTSHPRKFLWALNARKKTCETHRKPAR